MPKSQQGATGQGPQDENQMVVLVLCGGQGHSTNLMVEAVNNHPRYKQLSREIQGQPEARMLQKIAERFFGLKCSDQVSTNAIEDYPDQGFSILIEDKSTNCGANAARTREVLERNGISSPRSIVVSQDPTMCRRTIASFEKVYSDNCPALFSWPTFVPLTAVNSADKGVPGESLSFLRYDSSLELDSTGLWSINRFLNLIMGEIPRLRDDEDGYGPRGKGFISHVDIPNEVEDSWQLLRTTLGNSERL